MKSGISLYGKYQKDIELSKKLNGLENSPEYIEITNLGLKINNEYYQCCHSEENLLFYDGLRFKVEVIENNKFEFGIIVLDNGRILGRYNKII